MSQLYKKFMQSGLLNHQGFKNLPDACDKASVQPGSNDLVPRP